MLSELNLSRPNLVLTRRTFSLTVAALAVSQLVGERRVFAASNRKFVFLGVPSELGIGCSGSRRMGMVDAPEAFRRFQFPERLGATDLGDAAVPPCAGTEDPISGLLNGSEIVSLATNVATHLERPFKEHKVAVVVGGDCSLLLGPMLALNRLGPCGLLFIDGHADFESPSRYGASSELAIVTGHGPKLEMPHTARMPLVREQDVVALAYQPGKLGAEKLNATEVRRFDIDDLRRIGVAKSIRLAIDHLEQSSIRKFWVHFDADVMNSDVMSAFNGKNTQGLSYDELSIILSGIVPSPKFAGLQITILNPRLDPGGAVVERFVNAILHSFVKASQG